MATYTATAQYGSVPVTVSTDNFEELHKALAGMFEMQKEIDFLTERGADPESIVPSFRMDSEKHRYFSFRCQQTGKDKTVGQKQDDSAVFPFFPRRGDTDKEAGFYDPSQNGTRPAPQHAQTQQPTYTQEELTRADKIVQRAETLLQEQGWSQQLEDKINAGTRDLPRDAQARIDRALRDAKQEHDHGEHDLDGQLPF